MYVYICMCLQLQIKAIMNLHCELVTLTDERTVLLTFNMHKKCWCAFMEMLPCKSKPRSLI